MLLLLLSRVAPCAQNSPTSSPPPTPNNKPNPNPKQYNMAAPKDFTTENLIRSATFLPAKYLLRFDAVVTEMASMVSSFERYGMVFEDPSKDAFTREFNLVLMVLKHVKVALIETGTIVGRETRDQAERGVWEFDLTRAKTSLEYFFYHMRIDLAATVLKHGEIHAALTAFSDLVVTVQR